MASLSRKASITEEAPPPGGGKPSSGRVIRIVNNHDHTVQVRKKETDRQRDSLHRLTGDQPKSIENNEHEHEHERLNVRTNQFNNFFQFRVHLINDSLYHVETRRYCIVFYRFGISPVHR